ncbi:hypothetical protein A1A1_07869 [Planococcus antarcticus DSM 14505]|uniref:Uncharacterized protein n=1 Tax=Planococcus antarcticus DSM 14505 TaxID=1185653 RepID=A0A1C7DHV6_9BACL|nr:hypothetical protein [Planococcus antarcticus]ANU10997.1 hypothetical protein BBH88_12115 [Planococcus antarcticus DSM 14505]EIM07076.1 hypothetical protein A1A1_07869 [Planococcus antarcticus DSM 14505]
MKKFFGSLLIGLPLAFWWIGYEDITYNQLNVSGVEKVVVRKMDFDFVFYASLLVIAIAAVTYLVWSEINKKREEQFYQNYRKDSK